MCKMKADTYGKLFSLLWLKEQLLKSAPMGSAEMIFPESLINGK